MKNYYLGEIVVVKEGHGEVYEVDDEAMFRVVDLLQKAGPSSMLGVGGLISTSTGSPFPSRACTSSEVQARAGRKRPAQWIGHLKKAP